MNHLDINERRSIERYLEKEKGVREIARLLSRSPGTISEEIKNNSVRGRYRADRAQKKANLRRKASKQKCLKVAMNPSLQKYVEKHLIEDQSPTAISGRIKQVDTHLPYVSKNAIYAYVFSVHGRPLEQYLYRHRVKRKSGRKRGAQSVSDTTKISITKRPKKANNRSEFGHFEGDFIESGKGGTGSLLVLVERKTRYPFLIYTEDKTTLTINTLIANQLKDVPVKSVTLDNDISFQKHEELSEMIDAVVYFARPYTSSDKGTVENRNGRIREFVPKRCDISKVPKDIIEKAERHLRTRFMECLKFKSPEEAWEKEMKCVRIKKTPRTVQKLSGQSVRILG